MTSQPADRVLVVDDEESVHDSLQRHLRRYRVSSAYNGLQMLAALERQSFDAVLLDLEMPGYSGFELLPRLREREIPTIIVTAHAGARNVVEAIRAGAFDFIEKSLENYQLLDEHIQAAIAHSAWTRAGREPGCFATLERLLVELASIDLDDDGDRRRAIRSHEELARAVERLSARDHRQVGPSPYQVLTEHFHRALVRLATYRCRGNRQRAAALLGVSYRTFLRWSEDHHADQDPSNPPPRTGGRGGGADIGR